MGHYTFVNEFVFYTSTIEHNKYKPLLMEYINNNKNSTEENHKGKWLSCVNTSFFECNKDNSIYFDFIKNEVYVALSKMFKEIKGISEPKVSTVKEIWYNLYNKGGNQEVHTHNGADISGIYFLDLNEKNTTVFYSYPSSLVKFANNTFVVDFVKEGDIVLFPSNLLHYVLETTKNRCTIAFNIECSF